MGGKTWDWILGGRIEPLATNKIQQEEKRPTKEHPCEIESKNGIIINHRGLFGYDAGKAPKVENVRLRRGAFRSL